MLEFLWVADVAEATSPQTQRTRLWERCANRALGVNPFGIVFKSTGEGDWRPPFQTWSYCPSYLPAGWAIEIADATTLQEPELFYLPFLRGGRSGAAEPTKHASPLRHLRGLCIGVPDLAGLSVASRSAEAAGLLRYFESPEHVLEMVFDGAVDLRIDFRPGLPLIFRGGMGEG
jgi:hypothetical protein